MQRKPPYCLITQDTEDGSSQQNQRHQFINSLEQAKIVDIWADNFYQEMQRISNLTKKYNIIAIDTEFPSIQEYNQKFDYFSAFQYEKYIKLAKNVDKTAMIQLGMCIADQDGNVPLEKFCWQFNFKFEGNIEEISSPSATLLKKAGIDFDKFRKDGINYKTFTHQFIKSGLLLNKKNRWIVFHGGFDFSYLLKLIRNQALPKSIEDFYKSIKIYFPQKIDIKYILQKDKCLKKYGLSKLADAILCRRIGPQHQSGSDSLLTLQCYFKLKFQFQNLFNNPLDYENIIYGIEYAESSKSGKDFNKQCNDFISIPTSLDLSQNNYAQNNYVYYMYAQNEVLYPSNYVNNLYPQNYNHTSFMYDKNFYNKK